MTPSIGRCGPDVERFRDVGRAVGTLDGMPKSDDGTPGERERSTVERLAAGVVGSEAMKGATKRALEARERAVELQEFTLGALNLPSAAVIDRLTRRVRSVALRLESIEDGLDRLEDRLDDASGANGASEDLGKVLTRLEVIEKRIEALHQAPAAKPVPARKAPARKAPAKRAPASKAPAAKPSDGSR
jgi:hypothetical protein